MADQAPFVHGGLTIAPLSVPLRYSLRGDALTLAPFVTVPLPTRIGDFAQDAAGRALMLGPDEWHYIGEIASGSAGVPVSIVDIGDRQLPFELTGPQAAQVLMSGCPLDLDAMPPGRGARTIYETVEIVLIKHATDRFHVEVWRSFAPWLHAALVQAAKDL
jgi:sarcosine oxidase, subunit gamma